MTITDSLKLLGLSGAPTKVTLKKAFRKAALKYHPDTRGSNAQFIAIKTAYDTLMALSAEELSVCVPVKNTTRTTEHYDPFDDIHYSERTFFEPDKPAAEGYERKLRAKNCKHCGGFGFVTKNTDPAKGFLGRERRLCRCQWA